MKPQKKYPSYLNAYDNGSLTAAVEKTSKQLESCCLCPRGCKANRLLTNSGFCKTGANSRIYSYFAHMGEEPPISGTKGSGAIFFSGCNMRCIYCQNYEFSQNAAGKEATAMDLAGIMLHLQKRGCHNINLVTPSHVTAQILAALNLAIPEGLNIPLIYNSSGYDSLETIKLFEGIADIYLPDMRYSNNAASQKYSNAPDYFESNCLAVKEMHRQTGIAQIDKKGILKRGVIIRHLVLPNNLSGTEKIMAFIARELSPDTYVSLMSQYMPLNKAKEFPEISRRLRRTEYREAENIMHKYRIYNGWTQESGGSDNYAGTNIKPV